MDYEYRPATKKLLQAIWEKNIEANREDPRWLCWREEALAHNAAGTAKTFLVLFRGDPVGEGTLVFASGHGAIRGRTVLADGKRRANINALRIEKEHEGKGHISRLVRLMEQHALSRGCEKLTIGVEAREARNLAIYLHWGYREFVTSEIEDDSLVLYYAKELRQGDLQVR